MTRIRVKICGVTREEDALLAVELGAELIGLNFYPPSPRCLEVDRARQIARCVADRAKVVGVFVNASFEELMRVAGEVGLDLLQLHGDETLEEIRRIGSRALVAKRLRPKDRLPRLDDYPEAWGFLFESGGDPRYGGTGRAWDYGRLRSLHGRRPVWVAGGIGPDNARRAVQLSGADGIDVCSGIESEPGIKDRELLERLFEEIRHGETATAT